MVFSAANYEKAFPREDPKPVKAVSPTKPIEDHGNVLEEAEKVTGKEPDPEPDLTMDHEGGGDNGTE